MNSETGRAASSAACVPNLISASRSLKMPNQSLVLCDDHTAYRFGRQQLQHFAHRSVGRNGHYRFVWRERYETISQQTPLHVRCRRRQMQIIERLPAVLAGIGAGDVLAIAIRADNHSTVQVSPPCSSALQIAITLRLAGRFHLAVQLQSYRGRSTARNTPIGSGKSGITHAAQQVGQARLRRLFVMEQQIVFGDRLYPTGPLPVPCR